MSLKINLMQNYSENSVTANSSLLSPTGGVKSISPIQKNSMQYGYAENHNNHNMIDETKCETNYSINNKWNNTRNKHLTKHDTNDDVTSTIAWCTPCVERARRAHSFTLDAVSHLIRLKS